MLRRVLRERARLFAVFLVVSKVTICELAQRPIRIGFEEEGDEDDDEDDTAALTKKTLMTAATSQDRKHAKKKLNEEQEKRYRLKQMTRLKAQNFKDYTRIVLPLIMWLGLSIAVVTSSWTFMTKDVTSLYLLKTRSYVDASIAMIRFYTGEIVTHTGALNDPVLLGSRTKLLNSKDFLTYYHTVSLYGSVAEKVPGNLLAQNWYYMSYYSKGEKRNSCRRLALFSMSDSDSSDFFSVVPSRRQFPCSRYRAHHSTSSQTSSLMYLIFIFCPTNQGACGRPTRRASTRALRGTSRRPRASTRR